VFGRCARSFTQISKIAKRLAGSHEYNNVWFRILNIAKIVAKFNNVGLINIG